MNWWTSRQALDKVFGKIFNKILSSKPVPIIEWTSEEIADFQQRGFVEIDGIISSIDDYILLSGYLCLEVKTDRGTFSAFAAEPFHREGNMKIGDNVTICIYNCGGGYYPDNKVVFWSRRKN